MLTPYPYQWWVGSDLSTLVTVQRVLAKLGPQGPWQEGSLRAPP